MDRQFWTEFRQHFRGHGVTEQLEVFYILLVVVIAVAVIAGWQLNRWLMRSRGRELPPNWIVASARIASLLQTAFDQRVKIDLLLEHNSAQSRFISCVLLDVSPHGVVVELSESVRLSQEWMGRHAEVYFKIKSDDSPQQLFYQFTSEIVAIGASPHGNTVATLEFPDRIETGQKRAHLRIDPPSNAIRGFQLWPESRGPDGRLSGDMRDWGRPVLQHEWSHASRVRIVNISGGGIRFEFHTASLQARERPSFRLGDRFFVSLDLYEPGDGESVRLFLLAKVRNAFDDYAGKRLEIGLEFLGQGQKTLDRPDFVLWRELPEDTGVETIDNWVFKRHLEMHREKGIA